MYGSSHLCHDYNIAVPGKRSAIPVRKVGIFIPIAILVFPLNRSKVDTEINAYMDRDQYKDRSPITGWIPITL
ncbi:hypothetical protein EYZ11_010255 [Aspergillus tanneri]|uniref:Uncharacterized protein n=1 Tax=Aspergillus tanneri TaxID=1220188 RepID=A0A4S3J5U3_9EURO|nr:hypothetical protein EYZ11_010255 [Aspergillus tanneri]